MALGVTAVAHYDNSENCDLNNINVNRPVIYNNNTKNQSNYRLAAGVRDCQSVFDKSSISGDDQFVTSEDSADRVLDYCDNSGSNVEDLWQILNGNNDRKLNSCFNLTYNEKRSSCAAIIRCHDSAKNGCRNYNSGNHTASDNNTKFNSSWILNNNNYNYQAQFIDATSDNKFSNFKGVVSSAPDRNSRHNYFAVNSCSGQMNDGIPEDSTYPQDKNYVRSLGNPGELESLDAINMPESVTVVDYRPAFNYKGNDHQFQAKMSSYKIQTPMRGTRSCENTPEATTPVSGMIGGCCATIPGLDHKNSSSGPKCKLNHDNCLSLQDILKSFNGPISQEQAWALCYQCAKCFKTALQPSLPGTIATGRNPTGLCDVTELSHVLLHKDGDVHATTIRVPSDQQDSRKEFTSERKLVFSLGVIVFAALDFGLDEEEERTVAPDLNALITIMTQPEDDPEVEDRLQETDDEGIERDSCESEDDPLHQAPDEDLRHVHQGYNVRNTPRSTEPRSLNTVLQLCTRHLQGTSEQADTHYKAVVRALVAEALELSHFLEKVAADKQGNSSSSALGNAGDRHLDTLDFSDWTNVRIWRALQARFWVQVIEELRKGVKLKKVEDSIGHGGVGGIGGGRGIGKRVRGTGRGIEFELTPYEILMDDIRARRYRLRKTPSPSPHLRKDAHAVILDFIRSRPPLKKASERKLPPLERQSTPRELLMESIKRPPRPLRPSSSPKKRPSAFEDVREECTPLTSTPKSDRVPGDSSTAQSSAELATTPKSSRRGSTEQNTAPRCQPRRLIIPVDFKLDGEDDDEGDDDYDVIGRFEEDVNVGWRADADEDVDDEHVEGQFGRQKGRAGESANPWRRTGGLRLTRNEYHRFCDTQLESYDLATQCPSRRVSSRRHTVVGATGAGLGVAAGTLSLPHSRPQSRQHDPRNRTDPNVNSKLKNREVLDPELPSSIGSSQDELAQEKSPNKGNASLGDMFLDERLSLTLEEIVHIRSVLTKAELESLPVEGRVKEDVEKRRVCFLCLKTRFGILGPWGQRCRLCERTVCVKCYSKMRIPTEHFAHVPVVLLSPGLMLSPSSEIDGKEYSSPSHGTVRSLWPRPAGGVGSAPASPASKRRDPTLRNTTPTLTPSSVNMTHQDEDGAACSSLPPSNNSPAAASAQTLDKSRKFYCSSTNSSPARTSGSSSRYGGGDVRVAERLRGVAMVVCHDCRILVLQIIQSSRTTRATIRNNVISRLTLNLSPIYV
ncbi:protein spire isoform X1 [Athalia rosae]|uniref:protein spire isoform X1 n=1 Tax=Athalia rosae TaxID=37344 RepID=UPI002033E3D3|nr:protein spire isoform X1 [Athalia rosae]